MGALKIICTIAYLLICVAIVVIVLMQDSKSEGLSSAITGSAGSNSYWSKNKGRSKEGLMVRGTTALVVLFFIIAAVLNIGSF